MIKRFSLLCAALACSTLALDGIAAGADWRDSRLSPDERARLLEQELTQDERIGMLHSPLAMDLGDYKKPAGVMASAGYIAGVPRLGIPALHESDASLGVTNPLNSRPGDSATAMPSGLALASTWNPSLAREAGALIGREAHAKGFNVLLAGGVNLARDPRGGRNFEYLGEDPLLAGTLAGASIAGIQSQHVVSTMKHFALNGYENGRNHHNIVIGEAAMQESDLLAFKLALELGQPGAVMCAYNKVNGSYACENEALLGKVLKQDWGFRGWVMSDWGAVHSVAAAQVLDHQSGEQLDQQVYFGEPLKQAVAAGAISQARLSDMARRMLRSMLAQGLFEHPAAPAPIDYVAHARLAQQAAAEGMVLLRNRDRLLPLRSGLKRIVVIGGNASLGVLSGGGSSQVTPYGAPPLIQPLGGVGPLDAMFRRAFWFAPAPLDAIRERAGRAEIVFNDGRYPDAAAALARDADVVIVFATQWNGEGEDVSDLSLPQGQDALIAAVTAANPRTVVVLETGNPVLMPWIEQSGAVLEAWYPGQYGAAALADILFGKINPSGRLPMTFTQSPQQLPRPQLPGQGKPPDSGFDIVLNEGADVGYRWFARKQLTPLFPFGYGLSYTSFEVSNLQVEGGKTLTVHFDVTNTGDRDGADVPQVYLRSAAGKQQMRLIGWDKVQLAPGQRRRVKVVVDPRLLADYDTTINGWRIAAGDYALAVGRDAGHAALSGSALLVAQTIKP